MKGLFKSELIRKSSTLFFATLVANIIALIANLAILRVLGKDYFGSFKTVLYLFAFLPMLIDFGINSSLTKYIAEFGKRRTKESKFLIIWFLKIRFISYFLLVLAILLLKDSIAVYFLKDISFNYLVVAGALFTGLSVLNVFSFIVLGFQNIKLFSLYQFLNSVSSASLAFLLSPFGIFYMIIGWSLGPLIANIPTIWFVLKKNIFSGYKKVDMKKIFFGFSLPVYPIDFSTNLFTAIIPLLSLFFLPQSMSYYSFAFMFYYMAVLIPNSLSIVLFPKISELNGLKNYAHAKNILKKSFKYYFPIAIVGVILTLTLSEWFIGLIKEEFLPSSMMFKIIVSFGFIFGFNVIYANYLKGLGKVKLFALLTLIQNFVLIVISFVLVSSV